MGTSWTDRNYYCKLAEELANPTLYLFLSGMAIIVLCSYFPSSDPAALYHLAFGLVAGSGLLALVATVIQGVVGHEYRQPLFSCAVIWAALVVNYLVIHFKLWLV